MKLPFGKYRNQDLTDVDLNYLKWFEENVKNIDLDLREAINFEIQRREGDRPGEGRVLRENPAKWHRG